MSTQTTHTTGPWQADKWATGFTVSAPNSHYSICHLEDCNNDEANARLIAAAPDLLEAVKVLLLVPAGIGRALKPDEIRCVTDAVKQAQAAISKATNGQKVGV